MPGWYTEAGPMQDVVISSRVRLARNFKKIPFPTSENIKSAEMSIGIVKEALASVKDKKYMFIPLSALPVLDKEYLVETHMISKELAAKKLPCALVTMENNDNLSVMVNEEDHLRIQSIMPGFQIEEAYKQCLEFEGINNFQSSYAFSYEFGYLTSCPTNTGTAIRASAMVHLPAIEKTERIKPLVEQCRKMGVAVRGIYGENSGATGSCYQISNQVTLGFTEHEIMSGIINLIESICELERESRELLKTRYGIAFEDMAYRAYGTLANARVLSSEEALKLLSDYKIGVDTGIFTDHTQNEVITLMLNIQPACVQKLSGRILAPEERDIQRATMVRNALTRR